MCSNPQGHREANFLVGRNYIRRLRDGNRGTYHWAPPFPEGVTIPGGAWPFSGGRPLPPLPSRGIGGVGVGGEMASPVISGGAVKVISRRQARAREYVPPWLNSNGGTNDAVNFSYSQIGEYRGKPTFRAGKMAVYDRANLDSTKGGNFLRGQLGESKARRPVANASPVVVGCCQNPTSSPPPPPILARNPTTKSKNLARAWSGRLRGGGLGHTDLPVVGGRRPRGRRVEVGRREGLVSWQPNPDPLLSPLCDNLNQYNLSIWQKNAILNNLGGEMKIEMLLNFLSLLGRIPGVFY